MCVCVCVCMRALCSFVFQPALVWALLVGCVLNNGGLCLDVHVCSFVSHAERFEPQGRRLTKNSIIINDSFPCLMKTVILTLSPPQSVVFVRAFKVCMT